MIGARLHLLHLGRDGHCPTIFTPRKRLGIGNIVVITRRTISITTLADRISHALLGGIALGQTAADSSSRLRRAAAIQAARGPPTGATLIPRL